jgi:L-glyceraldehyde 3-phosphate reductase
MGVPLLIHQPVYSMLNRWIEPELLDVLEEEGAGCIPFSPLAQGQLTDRYADGIPAGSRATQGYSLSSDDVKKNQEKVRALRDVSRRRGQALSQMALAWVLRDPRITSAIIGVSSVRQLEENLAALDKLEFSPEELEQIDQLTA